MPTVSFSPFRIPLALVAAFLLAGSLLGARAGETFAGKAEEFTNAYWDIGVSRVFPAPEGLRLIQVFGQSYWIWTYSVEPVPTQDLLLRTMERVMEDDKADAGARALYAEQIKQLQAESGETRFLSPRAALLLPGEPARVDLADAGVRNWLERRDSQRYLTALEAASMPLNELPTRIDDSGLRRRRVVDLIAIFTAPDDWPPFFDIRLQGLGRAINPGFEPGNLMFWDFFQVADPARPGEQVVYTPSLRKTLTFHYTRPDNTLAFGEYRLDTKLSDWAWIWTQNIHASSPRTLEVRRPSGATRTMFYVPYKLWNNTGREQRFRMLSAGLAVPIVWQDLNLVARFSDEPGRRDYWLTLTRAGIEARIADGQEKAWVEANDVQPQPGVDLGVDIAAKSDILPDAGAGRHPDLTLTSQMRTKGIILTPAEIDNLDELSEDIRFDLSAATLRGQPVDDQASDLYRAYRTLTPALPQDSPEMARIAGATRLPGVERVRRLILVQARRELEGEGMEPTLEEVRNYNRHAFAPLVEDDILDWRALALAVRADAPAAKRLASALSNTALEFLDKGMDGDDMQRAVAIDALNRAFELPGLFTNVMLKAMNFGVEGTDLRDRGFDEAGQLANLTGVEVVKLNRLAFDQVAGASVRPCLDWAWLGRRLNLLALDAVAQQAGKGVVDVFFQAEVNGAREQASMAFSFRQLLPPPFRAYLPPPPDVAITK